MEKTILCYGDSNTWGYVPDTGERFDELTRWPRRLASQLGQGYYVVEAGLNGRTTAFDDPIEAGRNGLMALNTYLSTHCPIDLIIVMLGTNDTKKFLNLPPYMISRGLESIIMQARQAQYGRNGQLPKLLIVSPVSIGVSGLNDHISEYFDATSAEKANQLKNWYSQLAEQYGCGFLDAAAVAKPSLEDGIHLEAEGHALLAETLAQKIRALLA